MEAYLIVLIVVLTIILLGVNVYLLALYVHSDDKGWGTAIYCKVLVILGLTLCQAQALMVPLDVANRSARVGWVSIRLLNCLWPPMSTIFGVWC